MFGLFRKTAPVAAVSTDNTVFHGGAYRRHRPEDVKRYTALATAAFPEMQGRIVCFGADWLGRQFASDSERQVDGLPQILLLEPGTGEALEIPVSEPAFHTEELVDQPDAAVAISFFGQWLAAGGVPPNYGQCIGYRQPLFLAGSDTLDNLKTVDLEVYWSLAAQLLARVRDLPSGTPIERITIADDC